MCRSNPLVLDKAYGTILERPQKLVRRHVMDRFRDFTLDLNGTIEETSDGNAIAVCNELPLIGAGTTPEQALRSLMSCLGAYMEELQKAGKLHSVLSEKGLVQPNAARPEFSVRFPYTRPEHEPVLTG